MKNEKSEMERLNKVSNANRPDGYHDVAHKPAAHTPTIEPISLEANAFARAILTKEKLAKGEWIHGDEFERQVNLFAAFIVRAVNAHEELLTALIQVLDETGRECYCRSAPTEYSCGRCAAKRAIAKAEQR